MTGTNCDLFTHKSVPVIFEPPCNMYVLDTSVRNQIQNFSVIFLFQYQMETLNSCRWPVPKNKFHMLNASHKSLYD
jgi:hypothetical protein